MRSVAWSPLFLWPSAPGTGRHVALTVPRTHGGAPGAFPTDPVVEQVTGLQNARANVPLPLLWPPARVWLSPALHGTTRRRRHGHSTRRRSLCHAVGCPPLSRASQGSSHAPESFLADQTSDILRTWTAARMVAPPLLRRWAARKCGPLRTWKAAQSSSRRSSMDASRRPTSGGAWSCLLPDSLEARCRTRSASRPRPRPARRRADPPRPWAARCVLLLRLTAARVPPARARRTATTPPGSDQRPRAALAAACGGARGSALP